MPPPRRIGAEDSETRSRFVDAAETVLVETGAQGFSARQVAAKAGLTAQLLYYYFRTMDDLLRAMVRRINERRVMRFEAALGMPEPLRALWELMSDPSAAALASELSAIASHREEVREEIVTAARDFRAEQTRAVGALLAKVPGGAPFSAEGFVMIASALARTLVTESSLGLTEGHAEALAVVETMLARLCPVRR